jgi:integrase
MASLQARHSRKCKLGRPWTPFAEATREKGCTCKPQFHVVAHADKKLVREPVGRNRKVAERALTATQHAINEGEYDAPKTIKFGAWADEWITKLARPKPSTVESYKDTMHWAKQAFESTPVRKLSTSNISDMLELMREKKLTTSTQAKHLRVLHACLNSAIPAGYASRNPVKMLPESERPQPGDVEADYFENDELQRLFTAAPEGLWRTLFTVAYKTGLRQSELSALTWGKVDLLEGVLRVDAGYRKGEVGSPKSRTSLRRVELQPGVVDLLGEWWDACGKPDDGELVFPYEGGHIENWTANHRLGKAMTKAAVPVKGPTGEGRAFHTLRHNYAKSVLESGASLFWLSRQMGHSSYKVTERTYGHWERSESRKESEKVRFAV